MKYLLLFLLIVNCSKDPMSFDPRVTISKEIIKFFYEETKEKPTIEERSEHEEVESDCKISRSC